MKTRKLSLLLLGGALLLLSNSESRALPPKQHSMTGRIVSVDSAAQTFSLIDSDGKTRVFVWNDSTRFSARGVSLCQCALQIGVKAKLYYRREVGRLVGRGVRLEAAPDVCCAVDWGSKTRHELWTK